MSGYPHNQPNYGYGGPPTSQPYAASPYGAPPPGQQPYAAPPPGQQPYAAPPTGHPPYGAPPTSASPYGAPSAPYAPPPSGGEKPHKEKPYGSSPPQNPGYPSSPAPNSGYPSAAPPHGSGYPSAAPGSGYPSAGPGHGSGYPQAGAPGPAPYGSPFGSLMPSAFPAGTDPNVVACFQIADQDGSGFIDDKELQRALSSYNQSFSMRTVHLLMYLFTKTNTRIMGPKEFTAVFYSLQNWRSIFEKFDRDGSGKIDTAELREALLSLGFSVSPAVLDLLVSKFDKSGGKNRAIEYDNFIECCLTVKGLTEKFKEKDTKYCGSATFSYEDFMLTVLPFLIA